MSEQSRLQTAGGLLQQKRQAQKLTLEEVSELTRIPVRLLREIESDEYGNLPGPVYVRSFLQSYARALNIDSQEVLARYHREIDNEREKESGPALQGGAVWQEDVQVHRVGTVLNRKNLAWILGVVAVVVAALLIGRTLRADRNSTAVGPDTLRGVTDASQVGDEFGSIPVDSSAGGPAQELLQSALTQAGEVPAGLAQGRPPAAGESNRAATGRAPRLPLPAALPGDGKLIFDRGVRWPLVLRVEATGDLSLTVDCGSSGPQPRPILLPDPGAPPLPREGIVPGQPYACREGFVVYWGTEYNKAFFVTLSKIQGVVVTVNGFAKSLREEHVDRQFVVDKWDIPSSTPDH